MNTDTETMNTAETTMHQMLRRYFGYQQFRPLQQEVIGDVMAGNDTFVLMPTGGGKSLCYQIPSLLLPGLTVVVSPLIALMKDQVDGLTAAGVPATFINSTLDAAEAGRRKQQVLSGQIKLLYVAPERLVLPDFLALLNRANLSLVAIDEAHCISEWGHDFRVEYRRLTILREKFPTVPIIALTATANERVQQDILQQLQLRNAKLHRAGFNRPNLSYAVKQKTTSLVSLFQIVEQHRGESGIIYCGSRARTEKLTEQLHDRGYRALPYHAGLDRETRTSNQEAFDRGRRTYVQEHHGRHRRQRNLALRIERSAPDRQGRQFETVHHPRHRRGAAQHARPRAFPHGRCRQRHQCTHPSRSEAA